MIRRFISLEWKKFKRSSYFQRNLVMTILYILLALYFIGCFLLLGTGAYFILEDVYPDQDPLTLVNNYLLFWFVIDLLYRFFLQKLPVMKIKPFMSVPIQRKTIIHFLLGRTVFSFYNILPLFFFIPFTIVLLLKGYSLFHVLPWFLGLLFVELSINFINFLISKIDTVFYIVLAILILLIGGQYFQIFDATILSSALFNNLYSYSYAMFIPLILVVVLYRITFRFVRKDFYIDGKIAKKTKEIKTAELSWLNRFGKTATFLKNDIRMIWRNKRPQQVLLAAALFLGYGLLFYTNSQYDGRVVLLTFISMFITGGFLLSFGQLVPSWDSSYYKLLMSQNISYRKYLASKWSLMAVSVIVSFILTTPYLYFGWDIYRLIIAGAVFNLGFNSFITLFGGVFNHTPVDLNVKSKAFSNTQGFSIKNILIALPKIVGPIIVFYIPYKIFNLEAGLLALVLAGVIGLLLKNLLLQQIEKIYQKQKYKTIAAFEEND